MFRKEYCKNGHLLSETRKIRYVSGKIRYECHECHRTRMRKKNKEYNIDWEKVKESKRRYYSSEKGIIQRWKENLMASHNITIDEYEILNNLQENKCKICKKEETTTHRITKKINRLAIDHCHKTGKIRGLLCNKCNRGLGYFQDDINLLLAAMEYLS
jgi:hypothetical protein